MREYDSEVKRGRTQLRTQAQLTIADDLSVGDWIREGLDSWNSFPFLVGVCIPGGFESYVLIRHTGLEDGPGVLGSTTLTAMLDTLTDFTTTPENCFHALWEGYGWLNQGAFAIFMLRKPSKISWITDRRPFRSMSMRIFMRKHRHRNLSNNDLPSNTLPEGIMEFSRFQLPNRNYLLMRGPIKEALHIGFEHNEYFSLQSPNLIWPKDKSWIFVNEIDFRATLIGGSQELIQKILHQRELTSEVFHRTDTPGDLGLNDF